MKYLLSFRSAAAAIAAAASLAGALSANAQGLAALDSIVTAHGADRLPPISVQMSGTVERNGRTEPFRLVATRDEELRIEYGGQGRDTLVASEKMAFRDDGAKTTFTKGSARFNQLDITGLFLVEHLRHRAVRVEAAGQRATIGGTPVQRIAVQSDRVKTVPGAPAIPDRLELLVSDSGLLLGLSRSFFEGRPERYTETFLFSDFRKTGDLMLPHRIELYLKAKRLQTFTVESYVFDAPADAAMFLPRRTK